MKHKELNIRIYRCEPDPSSGQDEQHYTAAFTDADGNEICFCHSDLWDVPNLADQVSKEIEASLKDEG